MYDLKSLAKFTELKPEIQSLPDVALSDAPLSSHTTLHIGGTPLATLVCYSAQACAEAIRLLDSKQVPALILGGGSNLVVADGELDLVVLKLEFDEISINAATGVLRAEAGAVWDDVVSLAVQADLGGIECLSGIPGSAGAVPVQNVGAYGCEISDVLTRVLLFDRQTGTSEWVDAQALDLGYRHSNLKHTDRAVVLEIELQLRTDGLSAPLRFGELARKLGAVEAGERMPAEQVRAAVLELRRKKGMVLDAEDHDTWSAGSFFTNPVVPAAVAAQVQERTGAVDMPSYPAGENERKLSAAWLIERAGFAKGYPGEQARARLSTKHTLALTNRGGASAGEVRELAREIRAGVQREFGVTLHPEPVWVGMSID